MINPAELELLQQALARLAEGYENLPEFAPDFDVDAVAAVLDTVAELRHHLGALQTPETSAASSRRSQPRPTPQQPARGADWRAW